MEHFNVKRKKKLDTGHLSGILNLILNLFCYQIYELEDDDDVGQPIVTFTVPRDLADGFINNKKENYKFRYDVVYKCFSIFISIEVYLVGFRNR